MDTPNNKIGGGVASEPAAGIAEPMLAADDIALQERLNNLRKG